MLSSVFLQVLTKADSIIVSRISKLSEQVETVSNKVTVSPWIPIIAVVVTGLLVLVGQYIDRSVKRKQELTSELNELFRKAGELSVKITNGLKELSIQKNSREYWWYCYIDERNAGEDKEIVYETKYLSDHYLACDAAIICNLRIGELLAEYYGAVSKFKLLKKAGFDIEFIKKLITDQEFADAKEIAEGTNGRQALAEYELNRKQLASEYYRQFESIEALNETLKTALTKK